MNPVYDFRVQVGVTGSPKGNGDLGLGFRGHDWLLLSGTRAALRSLSDVPFQVKVGK